ncbi:MAG: DNA/RNA nuclease SfsA [Methanosphaera stadtmanae]|nr:DNA/RNA nuclease SfsA [Methanosphaera stadtmanae]
MKISKLIKVKFVSRPNRFTIEFKNKKNEIELAHLHDPGRLKELLIENTDVLIRYVPTHKVTGRKTKYDVIAIKYQQEWVLLNSSYHNKLVSELIGEKLIDEIKEFHVYKPEYTYGKSRLDFLLKDEMNQELYLEVKGCTLVNNGIAKFPDAPTKRGKKHVDELINIRKKSLGSAILILILQNNAKLFSPNYDTDKAFSDSLKEAYENNVKILPIHIITEYKNNTLLLRYDKILPISFKKT